MASLRIGLTALLLTASLSGGDALPPEQFWAAADLGWVLNVRADELTYHTVPDLRVRLQFGRSVESLNATWRHNLPADPQAGVVYRDLRYQRVVAVRLSAAEWDLIIADELAAGARP